MRQQLLLLGILFLANTNAFSKNVDNLRISLSYFHLSIDKTSELVVTFENFNEKQREELNTALIGILGIEKVGYCEKLNCFYFKYDSNIYRSESEAFESLMLKTRKFQPLLKTGTSISSVQSICNK